MIAILTTIVLLAAQASSSGQQLHCYEDFSACWYGDTYQRIDNDAISGPWHWRLVNRIYQGVK